MSVCKLFSHFRLLLQRHDAIFNSLGTKHLWVLYGESFKLASVFLKLFPLKNQKSSTNKTFTCFKLVYFTLLKQEALCLDTWLKGLELILKIRRKARWFKIFFPQKIKAKTKLFHRQANVYKFKICISCFLESWEFKIHYWMGKMSNFKKYFYRT